MRGLSVSGGNSDRGVPNFWKLNVNVDTNDGWERSKLELGYLLSVSEIYINRKVFPSEYKEVKRRIIGK